MQDDDDYDATQVIGSFNAPKISVPDATPTRIGRYELLDLLGKGSMGTVYAANDPFSQLKVAIKVANPGLIDDTPQGQQMRKLFFNEAHAAGSLNHPNIMKIFDAGVEDGTCYIAMEFLPDVTTLAEHTKPEKLLDIKDAAKIIYRLANALDYAHSKGIVHRDIKPNNILFTRDGVLKVADFSIALVLAHEAEETQFSGMMGTPLYMAPEQTRDEPVTAQADIFALGIVFYQLLTGRHPFAAKSMDKVMWNISYHEPPPPSDLRFSCPAELDYIVRRMLSKETGKRYRRGLEAAAELSLLFEELESIKHEVDFAEKFAELKNYEFFAEFSTAEIWELLRAGDWRTFKPGEKIITEGERGNSVFIIVSGFATVSKEGRELVDGIGPGECLGELAYIAEVERSATVTAKTELAAMELNDSALRTTEGATQARFLNAFVKVLARRVVRMTDYVIDLKALPDPGS
jgi:hypothetical protein